MRFKNIPYESHEEVQKILNSGLPVYEKATAIRRFAFDFASMAEPDWRVRSQLPSVDVIQAEIINREMRR